MEAHASAQEAEKTSAAVEANKESDQDLTFNAFRSHLGIISKELGLVRTSDADDGHLDKKRAIIITHGGRAYEKDLLDWDIHLSYYFNVLGWVDTQENDAAAHDGQTTTLTNACRPYNLATIRQQKVPYGKQRLRDEYHGSNVAANDAIMTLKLVLAQALKPLVSDSESMEVQCQIHEAATEGLTHTISSDVVLIAMDRELWQRPKGYQEYEEHLVNPGILEAMVKKHGRQFSTRNFVKSFGFASLDLQDVITIRPGPVGTGWHDCIHGQQMIRAELKNHRSCLFWHEAKHLFRGVCNQSFSSQTYLQLLMDMYFTRLRNHVLLPKTDLTRTPSPSPPPPSIVPRSSLGLVRTSAAQEPEKPVDHRLQARSAVDITEAEAADYEFDTVGDYVCRMLHSCAGNLAGVACKNPGYCDEYGYLHLCADFQKHGCLLEDPHDGLFHIRRTCRALLKGESCLNLQRSGECGNGHDNEQDRLAVANREKLRAQKAREMEEHRRKKPNVTGQKRAGKHNREEERRRQRVL